MELLFRRLNLAHTRRIYRDVADRAEKENWSYRDFLALLLAEEVAHRTQTRLQRCTRQAHFPFFKTIDEFDFSLQTTLRQSLLGSYLGPDFVTQGRSLILYGKAGRGKTHLAVAIGYRAIQNGFETLCTTAAELVEELSNASKKGCLRESLLTYTHPHVLIVDEEMCIRDRAMALPLAAFASDVDFTNTGGTLTGSSAGLTLTGSALTVVDGIGGLGIVLSLIHI